ncbi:hypothetical protein HDU88_004687 [Geranomyces variabilis]|nr:hypothetical protein HDU88_004687 [Geranomyces variabilis]
MSHICSHNLQQTAAADTDVMQLLRRHCLRCESTSFEIAPNDLQRCSRCFLAFYCSDHCAQADSSRHSLWCVPRAKQPQWLKDVNHALQRWATRSETSLETIAKETYAVHEGQMNVDVWLEWNPTLKTFAEPLYNIFDIDDLPCLDLEPENPSGPPSKQIVGVWVRITVSHPNFTYLIPFQFPKEDGDKSEKRKSDHHNSGLCTCCGKSAAKQTRKEEKKEAKRKQKAAMKEEMQRIKERERLAAGKALLEKKRLQGDIRGN